AAAFAFELLRRLPASPSARRTTPPRKLRIRELGELADLLLAVPGLTSPTGWQQLLDELPGVGTQVARQSASRTEALALLRTCEAYGAWDALADVLEVIAPDAPATAELIARLSQLGLR
ncbi:hypothetical protein AB4Z54_41230, partial [Streptomyces sp. MCAF7]